jgi:two-component system, OmpR family, phosphate regulon sensor histidine kinase PhoR
MAPNRFRNKLFLYYSILFVVFAGITIGYQYHREKQFRIINLNSSLNDIIGIVNEYIIKNKIIDSDDFALVDSVISLFPQPGLRVTIIAGDGKVLYDNFVKEYWKMENHALRPEVLEAKSKSAGTVIRKSESTGITHYYYAKSYNNYYLRAALIYDIRTIKLLKAGAGYSIVMVVLFLTVWAIILIISDKFSRSITLLRDFAINTGKNRRFQPGYTFPDNELGTIGREITQIYSNLRIAKDELSIEREKLFSHLSVLNEGVAFYSPAKELILANQHFSQYLHTISEDLNVSPADLFLINEFEPVLRFINNQLVDNRIPFDVPMMEYQVISGARYYSIRCIVFIDKSLEVIITDVTKSEKNKRVKQQMTSNIAHELKTPVTSVLGYLETLIEFENMEPEKRKDFLKKATIQANRLANLINDLATLNKIEEANGEYSFEEIRINDLIEEISGNFSFKVASKNQSIINKIDAGVAVKGNRSLVMSIFQNLLENSVNYSGQNSIITIVKFKSDSTYHYFSFSDNGEGVPQEHLNRLFERFYRVDSGRSRKDGGTGLGLSIVKNAILLHKGDISVRLKKEGGIEFLFSLPVS